MAAHPLSCDAGVTVELPEVTETPDLKHGATESTDQRISLSKAYEVSGGRALRAREGGDEIPERTSGSNPVRLFFPGSHPHPPAGRMAGATRDRIERSKNTSRSVFFVGSVAPFLNPVPPYPPSPRLFRNTRISGKERCMTRRHTGAATRLRPGVVTTRRQKTTSSRRSSSSSSGIIVSVSGSTGSSVVRARCSTAVIVNGTHRISLSTSKLLLRSASD